MDGSGNTVNTVNDIVIIVLVQTATLFFQIKSLIYHTQHLPSTCTRFYIKSNTGFRISMADNNLIQIHVTICSCSSHLMDAAYFHFLH
ncbi:hypothetical protein EVA_04259 [gut metagenome]|uniref:Uncharacterized protein n=1 Tax=gut metagenome TaxID=749906 RepID=J9GX60_9ZZZZ